MYTAMKPKKYSNTFAKNDYINTVKRYTEVDKSPPRRSDFRSEKLSRRKPSKCFLESYHME